MASVTLVGRLTWSWGGAAKVGEKTEPAAAARTVENGDGQAWPVAYRRDDYVLIPTMAGPMMVVAGRSGRRGHIPVR